jgi:flagellar biosynthetic protein FliP
MTRLLLAICIVVLPTSAALAQPTVPVPTIATPGVVESLSDSRSPVGSTTVDEAIPPSQSAPWITIGVGAGGEDGEMAPALKIIALLALMSFVPAVVLSMTSFTRIIVVLGLLRQAVGVAQLPPTRVMVGLALFMTLFTMRPVFERIHDVALAPYDAGELTEFEALDAAMGPLEDFMLAHTREEDLLLFIEMSGEARPQDADRVSTITLIPAFMLSELKTAFQIGALLFLPFLVIDIAVASILMSMGMMMLPPSTISLPLKIIVFVMVDGWALVARSVATNVWGG